MDRPMEGPVDEGSMASGTLKGRRPLAMPHTKSQMLSQIRKSLSHLHKEEPPVAAVATKQHPMYLGGREMTKSTPNLFDDKTLNIDPAQSSRNIYKHKEMQKIRQSLQGFQIADETDLREGANGYIDIEDKQVNEHLLRDLVLMGYHEEVAAEALRLSGNKSTQGAVELLKQIALPQAPPRMPPMANGFRINTSSGPIPYDQKAGRPIIDGRFRAGSPVSSLETSSVRSESPSQASGGSSRAPSEQRWTHSPSLTPPAPQQYTRRMSSPSDRLTPPPPLPPRGQARPGGGGGNGGGVSRPPTPPPPVPPQTYKDSRAAQPDLRRLPSALPPGRDAYRSTPNPPVMGNGPVTPSNGYNQMHNSRSNMLNSSAGMMPPTNSSGYRTPNSVGMGYTPQQQMVDSRGVSPNISQMMNNHEQPPPHLVGPGSVFSDTSPMSSNSPSPAPTPSPGAMVQNYPPGQVPPWQSQGKPPPVAMQAWGAKHPPIVLQQVKSREVPKPKLQTATAPIIPTHQALDGGVEHIANYVSSVQAHVNDPHPYNQVNRVVVPSGLQPGTRNVHIEIRPSQNTPQSHMHHHHSPHPQHPHYHQPHAVANQQHRTLNVNYYPPQGPNIHIQHTMGGYGPGQPLPAYSPNASRSESPVQRAWNGSPMSVISTNSTPSTNSDIPDKPPPPYPGGGGYPIYQTQNSFQQMQNMWNANALNATTPIQFDDRSDTQSNAASESSRLTEFDERSTTSEQTESSSVTGGAESSTRSERLHRRVSPKPQRKADAQRKDAERFETKVRQYSPAAYKFFMEQHIENVLKSSKQRELRRAALEHEMDSCKLTKESKQEMRKMLFQKESNHNRLKRAKMDKSIFDKIKTLGIGAFGEVALVRKKDTGYLYAMKTLRKHDVLQRNQVAHVKAERDILAEADCEWVVKLYYSFQDKTNLYFIMDYIPGGDMMSLLIKQGIFEEPLTRFYIAELVLAIESVHGMGFIHRDIKPDNILIDKDGHIKLTDFGLCTGFRWTHNSKYYQKGNHARQDSMEPLEGYHALSCDCDIMDKELLKPLEKRKLRHQRCLAHSLVGTPNYIAPEVLRRSGYSRCCDWWSVGVILYEMLVGSPPFLANTPQETQIKVVNWEKVLRVPREAALSVPAEQLIHSLLINEDQRLGRQGAEQIKRHPFFAPIQFEGLRQTKAPFIPKIRYPTDTSNFDSVDEKKFNSVDSRRDGTLENGYPEHAFFEFTFKRFFDEGGHAMAMKIPNPNGDDDSAVFV